MKILILLLSSIAVCYSSILLVVRDDVKIFEKYHEPKNSMTFTSKSANDITDQDKMKPKDVIGIKESQMEKIQINDNMAVPIKQFVVKTKSNQGTVNKEKLQNKFNFYAKKIYQKRNENQETNKSMEITKKRAIKSILESIRLAKYSEAEEIQGRKEYNIFVKNKNFPLNGLQSKNRGKRSSNIIEEETLSSTVSALKYTGQDTRLTNELYFKNINQ